MRPQSNLISLKGIKRALDFIVDRVFFPDETRTKKRAEAAKEFAEVLHIIAQTRGIEIGNLQRTCSLLLDGGVPESEVRDLLVRHGGDLFLEVHHAIAALRGHAQKGTILKATVHEEEHQAGSVAPTGEQT